MASMQSSSIDEPDDEDDEDNESDDKDQSLIAKEDNDSETPSIDGKLRL